MNKTNMKQHPYQQPDVPVMDRVEDLLARMSRDEKVAQMFFIAPANERLGIPAMHFAECLHGYRPGVLDKIPGEATSFPQAIAMASTWEPELVEEAAGVIAKECRAYGKHNCYSPVLDTARDPRWGRTEETYGEDPYLCSRIGVGFIHGLQGRGEQRLDRNHVIATAKHFAAYGEPARGINGAAMDVTERAMREVHLPSFEAAVVEARVESIMPAHTDISGIPAHANKWLLDEVLRKEWGFEGFVVSDNRDIMRLHTMHGMAETWEDAAKLALEAGVDQEIVLQNNDVSCYKDALKRALDSGLIDESFVDRAVRRIMRAKFMLGLFDNPQAADYPAPNSEEHRATALQTARKSMVLLKNEGGLLPLDEKRIRRLAVIGPNAAVAQLGGYTGLNTARAVSVLEGLTARAVRTGMEIVYAQGCELTGDDRSGIAEAEKAAAQADAAVIVVGESEAYCSEGKDRDSLELMGVQEELIQAVHRTGTPTIVILNNGRPLSICWTAAHAPAIIEAWYGGCEGGTAVAELLFGDINPSGKLPITFPRSVGQIPAYYNQRADFNGSGQGQYVLADKSPLFPFGYGLSYTNFEYGEPTANPAVISRDEQTVVSVQVTNTGDRVGEEIVQLYIRDQFASVTRPLKELKAFRKIRLMPGQTQTVQFHIGPEQLALYDRNMRKVVEPGAFSIMTGPNSVELKSTTITVRA